MMAPALQIAGSAAVGATTIFPPLRLEIAAGRWTVLLGPSGVGKSTLLRLVAGIETTIAFTGTIAADDGAPIAPRVAMMAQSDLLLPWLDVFDNITLGARLRHRAPIARARAIIEQVGLTRPLCYRALVSRTRCVIKSGWCGRALRMAT